MQYPNIYFWYNVYKNIASIGANSALGNRLLDAEAFGNKTALRKAIKASTPMGTAATLNLVAGPGLWDAQPAGGSSAVSPA